MPPIDTHRRRETPASRARELADASPRAHVLVVEDDESVRAAIERLLLAEGYRISTAPNGKAGLAEARRVSPDIVLTDLHMPEIGGADLCRSLHEIDPDLPVIVMTADSQMQSVIESLRAGAADFLTKPLQHDVVLWTVGRALTSRAAKREQEEVQRTLNERLVQSSIREQELAEAEARQRAQLTALLENLSEGVAIGDSTGRLLLLNKAARGVFGFEDQDLLVIHTESLEAFDLEGRPLDPDERPLARATRGEQFMDCEVSYARPDGERRRIVFAGTSVKGKSGDVELAIILFHDVTELRRLEQQRDEYLALVSHDLRNPLSVILMSLAMVKASMSADAGAASSRVSMGTVERLERNARRMRQMLDELTEATTLESHGVALRRTACDLRQVVAGAIDSLKDERARRIRTETEEGSFIVLADASRLERVAANLLTNALKYSAEDAPVTVRLARSGNSAALEVIDRGIGIAPANVQRLFDRYYRTPGGKAQASGLGLGLYIARLIVEAHGGRIEVSSEVGKGSSFRLILPLSV